jgi:hypothetical protein
MPGTMALCTLVRFIRCGARDLSALLAEKMEITHPAGAGQLSTLSCPAIPVLKGIKLVWSAQADPYGVTRPGKELEEQTGMLSSTTLQNHLTGHF